MRPQKYTRIKNFFSIQKLSGACAFDLKAQAPDIQTVQNRLEKKLYYGVLKVAAKALDVPAARNCAGFCGSVGEAALNPGETCCGRNHFE